MKKATVSKATVSKADASKLASPVKSGGFENSPRGLRNACIARGLDGNAFWSARGVANKQALLRVLLSLPKGEAPKGGKEGWLRIVGQAGVLAWLVNVDKRGVYSRVCPESGKVVGSLAAFKAGGVEVRLVGEAALVKEHASTGIDAECVATYRLGK